MMMGVQRQRLSFVPCLHQKTKHCELLTASPHHPHPSFPQVLAVYLLQLSLTATVLSTERMGKQKKRGGGGKKKGTIMTRTAQESIRWLVSNAAMTGSCSAGYGDERGLRKLLLKEYKLLEGWMVENFAISNFLLSLVLGSRSRCFFSRSFVVVRNGRCIFKLRSRER
jgi:hypothetical protein